eukprot:1143575-Pelagomonas_calceolata.AAC.4
MPIPIHVIIGPSSLTWSSWLGWLQESDLGINPMNDGEKIRLGLPQLTTSLRSPLVQKNSNSPIPNFKPTLKSTSFQVHGLQDCWKDTRLLTTFVAAELQAAKDQPAPFLKNLQHPGIPEQLLVEVFKQPTCQHNTSMERRKDLVKQVNKYSEEAKVRQAVAVHSFWKSEIEARRGS